jgi:hypothetical protein
LSARIASSLSQVSGGMETDRVTTERPVLGRPAPARLPPGLFGIFVFCGCFYDLAKRV